MSGISQRWELRNENFGSGDVQVIVISSPRRIVRDACVECTRVEEL